MSAAAEEPPSAVEDFLYPGAERILAEQQIKLVAGDGRFVLSQDCGPGPGRVILNVDGDPETRWICFQILGPTGYLSLEIPKTYSIRTDAEHVINAAWRQDGTEQNKQLAQDNWDQIGRGSSGQEATLLELSARAADGSQPALPSNPTHPFLGRVVTQTPSRQGGRACSATLIATNWVLTAKTCFANSSALTAGPPSFPTDVRFGGRAPVGIARLVPHADRDLVLAKLVAPVGDIAPVPVATSEVAGGQVLQAVGYGRTATTWLADSSHSASASLDEVTDSALALTVTDGAICKGDAGGPLLNANGQIAGVVTGSGQQGCLEATQASGLAGGARLDNLGSWINGEVLVETGYIRNGQAGKCLDVVGSSSANGAGVQMFDCYGTGNQTWKINRNDSTIRNAETGKCLDIVGASTANTARLQMYDCWGSWNQKWTVNADGTIRNPQTGKCLDIESQSTANGAPVQMYDCWGTWNQKFELPTTDGEIRNPHSGKCLDIVGVSTANGARIQLFECWGSWNQKWVVHSGDGTIRNAQTGKCLDVVGSSTANQAEVGVWDCSGAPNQKWTVNPTDGTIRSVQTGKCLDVSGQSTVSGTRLQMFDCLGNWNQKWKTQ